MHIQNEQVPHAAAAIESTYRLDDGDFTILPMALPALLMRLPKKKSSSASSVISNSSAVSSISSFSANGIHSFQKAKRISAMSLGFDMRGQIWSKATLLFRQI
ncbi:MAG: hypothetical protein ACXV8J_00685 [Methylobacter sp.]